MKNSKVVFWVAVPLFAIVVLFLLLSEGQSAAMLYWWEIRSRFFKKKIKEVERADEVNDQEAQSIDAKLAKINEALATPAPKSKDVEKSLYEMAGRKR